MNKLTIALFASLIPILGCQTTEKQTSTKAAAPAFAPGLYSNYRQLTLDGKRSGEGYFSADGKWMIFQSEREASNPFYQIYIQDLETKDSWRVSPGYGKTTCSWIAPDRKKVIFSSTHEDKEAKAKQKAELDFRASGQTRRYSWDYDEHYDIFEATPKGQNLKNLTHTRGYDAEGSISPDGKLIAFASNRSAYEKTLTAEEQKKLDMDPSFYMDIFIMNRDGSNVRQLTSAPGYDGGPFFSPDGKRITWRHFSEDGATAEIFTMEINGEDKRQLTHLNAMSWAPFYHPSGDYLVFTSSVLGFHNFELFIVDKDGARPPVRVTDLPGFDGLPVFTPDGTKLTWNHKISSDESQIFIADWNDAAARKALGDLPPKAPRLKDLNRNFTIEDMKRILEYLASRDLKGRETGSEGEIKMANMVADLYKDMGLTPLKGMNGYIQKFPFTKAAKLGLNNNLTVLTGPNQSSPKLAEDWQPVTFSKKGEFAAAPIVFAGYGISAPASNGHGAYNSYGTTDVKDKWVLVFRYAPETKDTNLKLFIQQYSRLEHKAIVARDMGAKGLIIVSGPNSKAKNDLVPFYSHSGAMDIGIPVLSISDRLAAAMLMGSGKDLKTLQNDLDAGKPTENFELSQVKISTQIDIRKEDGEGHNILGQLSVPGATGTIVIGAHGDHLGDEPSENSLRKSTDSESIHFGADDNASGVTGVLMIAHDLAGGGASAGRPIGRAAKTLGTFKKNIVFAVWSGEEHGNLGSTYFTRWLDKNKKAKPEAYLNMDMIGRWQKDATGARKPLAIQGLGSASEWRKEIEKLSLTYPVQLQDDPYLPTDAMAFYIAKVPVISFFTGVHTDYHSPRDTADKIDYEGLEIVATTVRDLAESLGKSNSKLTYVQAPRSSNENRRGFRIFLGTIPDYTQIESKGVRLSGVVSGGPAEKAGLREGDVIVEFAKRQITTMNDYVFSLETVSPGEKTTIVVLRQGKRQTIDIVPQAKE